MLLKLCVASQCYPPALTLQQQELNFGRDVNGCLPLLGSPRIDSDFRRHGGANAKSNSLEPLKLQSWLMDSKQLVKLDSSVMPIVIDMEVPRNNAVSFRFGIAEQCTSHEKLLQIFKAARAERDGCDMPLHSDMMQLQSLLFDVPEQLFAPSHFYPNRVSHAEKPFVDLCRDLGLSSKLIVQPDGQLLFTGNGSEMKDILSVVAEFHFSKNTLKFRKPSMLVPHYRGLYIDEVDTSRYSIKVPVLAPLESPEKIKVMPNTKKKNGRRAGRERDLYQKNYFHACESLLSLLIEQKGNGKTAILTLKKSGTELPEFMTQISAGIAGTGIALLFSVVCKIATGRVPFCAYKLLNTGFGFGLVWLSWAVNRMRDTVIYISKNTGKSELEDEELLVRVDKSTKEIRFRAAALLAVAVLRFA